MRRNTTLGKAALVTALGVLSVPLAGFTEARVPFRAAAPRPALVD
jgi:hypothetical protein